MTAPSVVSDSILSRPSRRGEPAWEIALLFPRQGDWTEVDYFALDTNRIVELSDGFLDVHLEVDDPTPPDCSRRGSPPWAIALLYPWQGDWSDSEYQSLIKRTNRLIELSDGCLEFLPMAYAAHQLILKFLLIALDAFVTARQMGTVLCAPLPVRLWKKKEREPDIIFLESKREFEPNEALPGADLVMEIVSEGNESRQRDLVDKRQEYAAAGIAEYWIVDPEQQQIVVLTLEGKTYREHGVFVPGQRAGSVLLSGFDVAVSDVFAAGTKG